MSGARALPWNLYLKSNEWMMNQGTGEGIYGCAFAKTTVNLACRGDNTGQICVKHLIMMGDSFGVPFAHEKRNQKGEDALRKLPRQCYCNPLDQSADIMSSLFHYMALNPDVIANKDGPLFTGTRDAQASTFTRILQKVLKTNADDDGNPLCESEYSTPLSAISLYSFRKCAITRLNCGSTAGPSGAAACLREGHSVGTTRNRYIAQERASDEYCGRILSGLPVNSEKFAASYPDFIPIDIEESMTRHVSDRVYQNKKKEVDRKVRSVLDSIFGREHMSAFPTIHKFLRIGLAAHLWHLDKIEELLPQNSILRQTTLFTNPDVADLRPHVRIAMPWEDHAVYFADATGLPPHVLHLSKLQQLEDKVDKMPKKLEDMLEAKQMNGPVSLAQMKTIVATCPIVRRMEATMIRMEAVIESRGVSAEPDQVADFTGGIGTRFDLFDHPDGKKRRIPPSWEIPKIQLQHIYLHWHCGNLAKKISPIKNLSKADMSVMEKRTAKSFCELKRMMGAIDKAAAANGKPVKNIMTQVEAGSCFFHGQHALNIPTTTKTNKPRNIARLKWTSAARYMPKAK